MDAAPSGDLEQEGIAWTQRRGTDPGNLSLYFFLGIGPGRTATLTRLQTVPGGKIPQGRKTSARDKTKRPWVKSKFRGERKSPWGKSLRRNIHGEESPRGKTKPQEKKTPLGWERKLHRKTSPKDRQHPRETKKQKTRNSPGRCLRDVHQA